MQVHVARQPIFAFPDHAADALRELGVRPSRPAGGADPLASRTEQVVAYELLFRDGPKNSFPDVDGNVATSGVLHHSFFANDFDQLVDGRVGFVNFTRELLVERIPSLFPPDRLVIEVLETVRPDAELVAACRDLRGLGYKIVLDDFVMRPDLAPLLELAWMIKFDVRATPIPEIAAVIKSLERQEIRFLAEKVETRAEVAALRDVGCDFFQGYFFARPEVMTRTDIAPSRLVLLRLMDQVMREETDLDTLERLIASDVSLSFKLLRYINSAFFARSREIDSIRQALILLGEREVRQFVLLVVTARLAARKPEELVRLSIIRARMGEALSRTLPGVSRDELFLLGLFASIDAIMDRPMAELAKQLPLSPVLKDALVERKGLLGEVLELILAYERADWSSAARLSHRLGLDEDALARAHREALAVGAAFIGAADGADSE